nr:histidine--tRNA ligase, cytoplasmic [Tanacetum cinerariifolium]
EKEITFPAEAANETEMAVDRRVLTLGGKGSSLSSTSVFEFATASLPQILKIDPAALARLSSSSTSSPFKLELSVPDYLTPEEARASILLLLNKLLLGGS